MSVKLVRMGAVPKGWKPIVSSYLSQTELDNVTPAAIAGKWAESLCWERGYDPKMSHRFGLHVAESPCRKPYAVDIDGVTIGLYLL